MPWKVDADYYRESGNRRPFMSNPPVMVFDLGKVLLDFDYTKAARRIAAETNVSSEQIRLFIDQSPLLFKYEKGLINSAALFEEIRRMSGYGGTLSSFAALFSDVFTPITPMIELQGRLVKAGIPTYIFSNTNDLAIAHIQSTYPFFKTFNGYILSYEHGFMKPEVELYAAMESCAGRSGPAICYLDDREENVAMGRRRGWRSLLHVTPTESIKWVHQQLDLPRWEARPLHYYQSDEGGC